ncbi:MAG TPA: hypothetical protein VK942_14350 [Actinomycetes bacterium]|nr:hypothetical protein [Actinomycetes bacterium]
MERPFFALARVAVVGVTCVAIAGFMGCSSGVDNDDAGELAGPTADAATHDPAGQAVPVEQPGPVELRAQLEQLLGQHAILTVRLTRARLRGDEDLAQSADEALSKNAAEIAAPIGAVYGAEAAETFEQTWFNHVTSVFNYARGVADDDAAVMSEARRQLDDYVTDLSEYLGEATHQAIPAEVVAEELRMHVNLLLEQVDAYAAEDYERAFQLERESYAHMFPLGKALAAGIVTGEGGELPADFDNPARELQSQLGMRFGEHAELAVDAMRSGISDYPDFPVAAATLDQNTREITAMIESVFGGESARSFQTLWSDHIDAFVAYTQALAQMDEAAQDAAQDRLTGFNSEFANFLSTSTDGRLATAALADAFVMHEEMLLKQINEYAAADYVTAHQVSYEAYQHMFALADQAATAIGETVAAGNPQGGAETGSGAMAAFAGG